MNRDRFPLIDTIQQPERAILVGIDRPGSEWSVEETLAELERLADTAGAQTVATTIQRLETPNPRTFVGSGKAQEIASMRHTWDADLIIFDDELTPSQQSNLEHIMGSTVKVIDRTALILDIFALRASTKEGRLQVRLAQNKYLLPRLRGMWAHLASNRMGGGVGSRFGEGESQLEVDRRIVRKRIIHIERELAELDRNRNIQRRLRQESGMQRIALAGYTNAGKSSLLNCLTDAGVLTYDKLFATLDATTRKLVLPEGREVTLTDTVGFIQKLPTTLIEAFKSTLDEIREADIILHVVDAQAKEFERQIKAALDVLQQINAQTISRILVFNKSDLLTCERRTILAEHYEEAVFVSAHTKEGIDDLIRRIVGIASAQDRLMHLVVPYARGEIVSAAHERCFIVRESYEEDGTHLTIRANERMAALFKAYEVIPKKDISAGAG